MNKIQAMKIFQLINMLLIISMFGCAEKSKKDILLHDKEIQKLNSNAEKKKYLESIFEQDQKVRGEESSAIMIKYGKDSVEFREYIQTQINQDSINLIKIERYFVHFGYPNKSELGEIAAATPWAVIHHAQGTEARERNFAMLYQAYLTGDIDDGNISMFLGRLYQLKNGERFRMQSPYKSEDEINQLIKELNLEDEKEKILGKLRDS